MVSHAWSARFWDTLLNVVLDATGWSPSTLESHAADPRTLTGALEALGGGVLESSYWLCVFAVNQHRSLCGDCPDCNEGGYWASREQWIPDPCFQCNRRKPFPCICGGRKHARRTPPCEVDKLGDLAQRMECLVVSLDPELAALSRAWVVREAGEALRGVPVRFCLASGLSKKRLGPRRKLLEGRALLPPVQECCTSFASDKRQILEEVDGMLAGRAAFDGFLRCLLDLRFGQAGSLEGTDGEVAAALGRLERLEMDLGWQGEALLDLAAAGLGVRTLGRLRGLRTLAVNFSGCEALSDVAALRADLAGLGLLRELELDFSLCRSHPETRLDQDLQKHKLWDRSLAWHVWLTQIN